jgi:hypothetical protein
MVSGEEIDMTQLEYWESNEENYWIGESAADIFTASIDSDYCYNIVESARPYMDLAMYSLAAAGVIKLE